MVIWNMEITMNAIVIIKELMCVLAKMSANTMRHSEGEIQRFYQNLDQFFKGSPFKWLKNSSPTKLIIILVVVIAILSSSSVLVQRLNAMIGKPTPLSSRATCDITGTDYQILKFEGDQTWEQAQKWCKKQGGHLAIVSSDEENAFLYLIMVGIGEQNAYIGCSKTNNKMNGLGLKMARSWDYFAKTHIPN